MSWRWLIVSAALVVAMLGAGCPQQAGDGGGTVNGNPVAGQATFNQICSGCHRAASLAGVQGGITNNMGSISMAMIGINLTDQQVADLQAFIATQ